MTGSYDIDLVLMSIVVAMAASYVALDLVGRVTESERNASRWWLLSGAFVMGAGIWSMYFIGMLAFTLPIRVSYGLTATASSLVIAILISGFALSVVSQKTLTIPRLLSSGVIMGGGICAMHYTGMAAMQMMPPIRYDPLLFAASVFIAIGASLVALHLAFTLRARAGGRGLLFRILSAMVMGLAIAGMHYTGMAAAHFGPGSVSMTTGSFDLPNEALAYVIGTAILCLLAVTLLASIFDSYMTGHRTGMLRNLQRANQELRFINDVVSQTTQPFGAADLQGRLVRWNRAYERLTGYNATELRNMPIQQLSSGRWPDLDAQKIAEVIKTGHTVEYENEFRRKDGSAILVHILGDVYRNEKGEIEYVFAFITDISERKRVEAELEQRTNELRFINDVVAQTDQAFCAVDAQGRLIRFNHALEMLNGYNAGELQNMSLKQLSSGRWPDRDELKIAELFQTGQSVRYENEYRRKDGSVTMAEVVGGAYRNQRGDVECVYAFITDLTERKKMEDALQESADLARSVIETAYHAYIAMDDEGRISDWNRQAESTFGWSREEVLGRPLADLIIPSQHRQPHREGIQHYLRTGEGSVLNKRIEITALHRDGHEFPVELTVWATRIGGRPRFSAFLNDITERKRMEETLQSEREFLRKMLKSLNEGIGACDADGILTFFNPALEKVIGLPVSPIPREQWNEHYNVYLPDGLTLLPTDQMPLIRALTGEIVDNQELVFAPRGQPRRTVLVNARQMVSPSGRVLGAVCAVHDITERKAAAEELDRRTRDIEQTNLELERANKELEQFVFASAHDLQTPLRGIVGFAQLLQRKAGDKLDQQSAEYLLGIVNGTYSMQRLVQSLLEYSRISNRPDRHWADLNYLLDEAKDELKQMIDGRGAVIESAGLPTLYVDARQVAQLLRSLISNAIKFQPGERPQVRISARQGVHEWIVSVADNGIGIPAGHHKRIFQIFQRLHTSEQYEGAGVGLALSEKIVHNHDGRMWVESTPGGGSTFYFSIPEYSGDG